MKEDISNKYSTILILKMTCSRKKKKKKPLHKRTLGQADLIVNYTKYLKEKA